MAAVSADPDPRAWSLIAGVAAVTSKAEIGTLVPRPGCASRPTGKVIATIDNSPRPHHPRPRAAGCRANSPTSGSIPADEPALVQLGDGRTPEAMWTEPVVNYDGKYVKAQNLVCEPKPVRVPPILIGGSGEKVTLKLAAQHADIWNHQAARQSELPQKIDVLKERCAEVGRDFSTLTISQQCLVTIAPDEASAAPMVDTAKKIFGGHMGDPTGPLGIAGARSACARQIRSTSTSAAPCS